jgi:pantoate--beta-alanine ligase
LKIFNTKAELEQHLSALKHNGLRIGFVPTMGALHQGHLSLINLAKQQTDVVVCSIFVNPTQFNEPKDLELYPKPIASDIEKLESVACDVLFNPATSEMYAENEQWALDLDGLDLLLEGEQRPGHYQGVTQIVKKLFDCVQPHRAFFGQKDYQQFLVIEKMVKKLAMKVELVMCPIVRESDGLAMSSRNIRLSAEERKNALAIYQTLCWMKDHFGHYGLDELKTLGTEKLRKSPGIVLEYLEICDGDSLLVATNQNPKKLVVLVAAKLGNTRLIDNILLK